MRKGFSSVTLVPLLLLVASGTGLAQWNGEIEAWGYNAYGQCDVPEPNEGLVAISGGGRATHLSPGDQLIGFSLGLREDASIVAWGYDANGQCDVPEPNEGFVAVSAGGSHSLGLKADGSIVVWGWWGYGVPEPNEGFVSVAAGNHFSLGLKTDGSILAWGMDFYGTCDVPEPNQDFISMATAGYEDDQAKDMTLHSLGLKADGSVVAWGCNYFGQCDVPEPNEGFVAIAVGGEHSLGVKADGSIVAWGRNNEGQCDVPEPNNGFVAAAGGAGHSLGLKEDGSIVAWGRNDYGQCDVPEPNEGFVSVSSGNWHSLGLREISTGIEDEGLTGSFIEIRSVAPNPFPATTNITIALSAPGPVRLDVFDLAGRQVSTLLKQTLPAGNHTAAFDGSELPPGVYLVRLTSGSECATAKVVLVR